MAGTDERVAQNREVIEEFRARGGVVGGRFEGLPLLLLTTTGARSGEPRVSPLAYLADGGRWVVFGANGGRTDHPGWYHNVLAEPAVRVEVGGEAFAALARPLADGEERDRLWATQTGALPVLEQLAGRTGRTVPVVVLERVDG
ncbi:nitroreductase/quinone reductase family protein [Streptomyces sp. CB01881]|uniref:nitroreductase/quinone reductase family protein n=1 Tax=Streptomyces sp. CB01881 TaxID=2078691 RepID=UPI000CDBE709|nr:nitroreductase/quinone reductase family protein [Streptomyces sp. CB01881]AUY51833.1 nitroreductase family deazaflavin-dependent oxidoreductase [Streptomyces sp. CB01881]TYC71261.1 nitroreductase family deazaflavin-dependent oxidoreductase [Streptomyces sp. CB01881]